jgi:hypothetical protein
MYVFILRVRDVVVTALAIGAGSAIAHPNHSESVQQVDQSALAAIGVVSLAQPGVGNQQGRPQPMNAVELPDPEVSITIEGDYRVIKANGLPGHSTGAFPNKDNPNALRAQTHEYKVPVNPTKASQPISARPEFGIALNGVIFDSGTGEFWSAERGRTFGGGSEWNYEALGGGVPLGLDEHNAHVQPTGKYHYHGLPIGLLEELGGEEGTDQMILLGWAFDGFPIYGPMGYVDADDAASGIEQLNSSYQLKDGERADPPDAPGGMHDGTFGLDYEYVEGTGDLDECNGRFGVTPEFPEGTYYYVITEEFPNVPRMWRGEPESLLMRRGPDARPEEAGQRTDRPRRPGRGLRPSRTSG